MLLYIETGLLPVQALIEARQFKFFTRFPSTLLQGCDRQLVFEELTQNPSNYLKHYQQLIQKYTNHHEIFQYHLNIMKGKIREHACKGRYKFDIYLKINPDLQPSPLLNCSHPLTTDIIRFRLGSHNLPIEKGRWSRLRRDQRICTTCNILGDEKHLIYDCSLIYREDLVLSNDISCIWTHQDVFHLFGRIKMTQYL